MLVSHRHRFIFLKTHKTASTSIEGFLEPLCAPDGYVPQHRQSFLSTEHGIIAGRTIVPNPDDPLAAHSSAQTIKDFVGQKTFAKYRKVYSIRNPFDKVVSWFWHVMPRDRREAFDEDPDKAVWLFQHWLSMRPNLPEDRGFYRTRAGIFDAQRIRYERMGEDLARFADGIGVAMDVAAIPSWKTTSRRHRSMPVAAYYDEPLADIVRQRFGFDFERFNYSQDVQAAGEA